MNNCQTLTRLKRKLELLSDPTTRSLIIEIIAELSTQDLPSLRKTLQHQLNTLNNNRIKGLRYRQLDIEEAIQIELQTVAE